MLWDKIQEARGTKGGLYFKPGNYLAKVQRCMMIKTRQGHEAFVAEFEVIETDVEDVNLRPGAKPSYFIDMDSEFPELSLGNVADFMRAGLDSLAKQHDEEVPVLTPVVAKAITEEDNLLAGVFIDVYAFNKPTRKGKDFTRINWSTPQDVQKVAVEHAV